MANVGSDTGGTTDIVEAKLCDVGVELEEEGQGLADSSTGTEDGDLGLACSRGRELARLGKQRAGSAMSEHGDWRWRRGVYGEA